LEDTKSKLQQELLFNVLMHSPPLRAAVMKAHGQIKKTNTVMLARHMGTQ